MLLLLLGKSKSGKDTIGNYLVEKKGWIKFKFATIMKEALKTLFNWDNYTIEEKKDEIDPYWDISPRFIFQNMGTEYLRVNLNFLKKKAIEFNGKKFYATFHIKRIHKEIIKNLQENKNIVICDGRFKDECTYTNWLEGKIIKLDRNTDIIDEHSSEQIDDIKTYDILLQNNGTKEELYEKIEEIIKNYDTIS